MDKDEAREELLKTILDDMESDMKDEDMIKQLVQKKLAANTAKENLTFSQIAADKVARFAGSWPCIFAFTAILIIWMIVNCVLATKAFDPYPYIFLNLILSCLSAVQAPLILMSQNRQEEKDRTRAENDYKINLKNEFIIEDLHEKLTEILRLQQELLKATKANEK